MPSDNEAALNALKESKPGWLERGIPVIPFKPVQAPNYVPSTMRSFSSEGNAGGVDVGAAPESSNEWPIGGGSAFNAPFFPVLSGTTPDFKLSIRGGRYRGDTTADGIVVAELTEAPVSVADWGWLKVTRNTTTRAVTAAALETGASLPADTSTLCHIPIAYVSNATLVLPLLMGDIIDLEGIWMVNGSLFWSSPHRRAPIAIPPDP